MNGMLRLLLLGVLGSALISCANRGSDNAPKAGATPPSSLAPNAPVEPMVPRKVFNTGEAVPAGYLGYKVLRSWFSDHLSQKDGKQPASGNYLNIELAIVNTDKKERELAPMKLIDETGREYALSGKSATIENDVAKVGKVGSNQSKRAVALFEAPQGHQYKLKIQGFSASDEVEINLSPESTAASR